MSKKEIFVGRVKKASDAFVAASFATSGLLVYQDGKLMIDNFVFGFIAFMIGVALYSVTTWWLMEMDVKDSID